MLHTHDLLLLSVLSQLCDAAAGLQAAALGDQLVVGLIPDSEILRCKGPPVMDEDERRIMIDSVKWVGQVITGARSDNTIKIMMSAGILQ